MTAFEAAITVTLAEPGAKAVHRLRTCSRRIEAQLVLLDLLPGLPVHAQEARRARRSLAKVRAAAGEVRDLDVLRALARKLGAGDALADDARALRKALRRKRARCEVWLVHTIELSLAKLAPRLEELADVLAPAMTRSLPADELTALGRRWFVRQAPSAREAKGDDGERLHAIRKAAKLARYLAEGAPGDAGAAALAESFEQVQRAGGAWHDRMLLARLACKRLGASSPMAMRATQARDEALTAYERALAKLDV